MASSHHHCECARPQSSGRKYLGKRACLVCGFLIVGETRAEQLRREAREAQINAEREGRTRVMGGLEPLEAA